MTVKQPESVRRVLVTGDVVRDHYIYEGQDRRSGSTTRLGTQRHVGPVGAWQVFEILKAVAERNREDGSGRKLDVSFGLRLSESDAATRNSYCLMRPFAAERGSRSKVWRLGEALGFDDPQQTYLDESMVCTEECGAPCDIVVLDDAALCFGRWPSGDAWPDFLHRNVEQLPDWLVLKLSAPIATGDLWHTLTTGEAQTMTRPVGGELQQQPLLRRSVAIVSINDLRKERVHVSGALSWERAAMDLVHELAGSPELERLRQCRFVIVTFDTDGAVLAEFPDNGEPEFRLVFDPAGLEGDFSGSLDGKMFGMQACLAASLATHLPDDKVDSDSVSLPCLEPAVRSGLSAMRRLLSYGHGPVGPDDEPAFPADSVSEEIVGRHTQWSYGSAKVPTSVAAVTSWTIVAGASAPGVPATPLWGLARRVAIRGLGELRQTPYQQFGDLFSVERIEIESLRSLRRLFTQYEADRKADKPLSIAVFGPPGSGKSFCVKQLARAAFATKVPLLEFNLSQFSEPSQLNGALHQVRDKVLDGGLPLVFWDEFDSSNLKWLQYILGPMQDGSFLEGQITHPVGKSIFVFAGGTRFRYQDFGQPPQDLLESGSKESVRAWEQDFRARKGPDFKSRLAGYLDVLGPNPKDETDVTFPVRRALLLRVHLKRFGNDRLAIDPGLLSAFLGIPEFRHGARSLEKIAEQIRLASLTGEFWRSHLPSRSQLDMHVDADKFLKLVERDV